ncbi:MAG: DUF58 domain-containing protein [Deltaproteobacteria bacterium]
MHLSEIKNRVLKLLRPPRQLRFTPEGTRFVIVALAIGVAAINTGNNLLYLILAMLLSMITLSGILSESSLRMVEIKRGLPKVAFAGKPFVVKITAVNNKRRLPSISLTFQDHMDEKREAGSRYFLKIPPNGSESGNYHFTLEGRGLHRFRLGRLATKYPFGLFLKSKDAGEESEILVYPRILDVKELLRETGVNEGELESSIKGRGTDLYGLRSYISGDDRRAIHWKTSARLSKLYIREFAREDARKVTILLDDCIPAGLEESLEKGIVIAASLASHFLHKGYQVGLVTSGEDIPLGIGMEQLFKILRALALLSPGKKRGKLLASVETGGVLILPYDSQAWKGKEGSFSKIIKVTP